MDAHPYNRDFFAGSRVGGLTAARAAVPLVLRFVKPASMIDVGCGIGAWLSVFREHGVEDFVGVDGPWVDRDQLLIPKDRLLTADLTRPLRMERRFDLVLCLEVAEHLPAAAAGTLVDSLTSLGDAVLFSAAIPKQGGDGPVNEQWPAYWVERFKERGYVGVDCFRRRLWHMDQHETWLYAQNLLLFVRSAVLERYPLVQAEYAGQDGDPIGMVHPVLYQRYAAYQNLLTLGEVARLLPWLVCRSVSFRWAKLRRRVFGS